MPTKKKLTKKEINKRYETGFVFREIEKPIDGVFCRQCGKIMVSWSVHDYKTCGCPNETMVDGGRDYLRYGGMEMSKVQAIQILPLVFKEDE